MGTSQKLNPGGSPNWGKTSSALSSLANAVGKENSDTNLFSNPKFQDRKRRAAGKAVSNYIKAKGGKTGMTRNASSAIRAGGALMGWLGHALDGNFSKELQSQGFGKLIGKTKDDVLNFLSENMSGATSNFNDTAAKSAVGEIMDRLLDGSDDAADCEAVLLTSIDEIGLENILVDFWGIYIHEDLSQRFEERLFTSKGEEVCNQTFAEIKDYVAEEIKLLDVRDSISSIDWQNTTEREKVIEEIFETVISIFEDE